MQMTPLPQDPENPAFADADATSTSGHVSVTDLNRRFKVVRDPPIDVTMLHRPDTDWVTVDRHGHEHRWFIRGQPATSYDPSAHYDTPSLVWVKDGEEGYPDDDEPHDVGHHECRQCGQRIEPGYTADSMRRFIPGLATYYLDGESVTQPEFEQAVREVMARHNTHDVK